MKQSEAMAVLDTPESTEKKESVMVKMKVATRSFIALMAVGVLSSMSHAKSPRTSVQDNSRKADYIFMEAMRQHSLDNEDAYYELLGVANELDPTNTETAFYRGYYDMMMARGDSAVMARGYEKMRNHFNAVPTDYYSSFIYGNVNDQLGRRDESLRVWSILDSIFPDKDEVAVKLAETLVMSQEAADVARAIEVYNRIEQKQGPSIPLATQKIKSYLITRDTTSILHEVRHLIDSSPVSAENNVFAGDIYGMFSLPDSALSFYDRAIAIDPTFGMAYYSRANYYKSINDSVGYDREVFNALKQDNLELDTKLELLTSYIRELYKDPAQQQRIQELFASLIDQHPHEVAIHDLYCSYLIAIDDYRGAAEQLGYALDADPSREDRWRTLATLYVQVRDYDAAKTTVKHSLDYFPKSHQLHSFLGSVYSQMHEFDNALNELTTALELVDATDRVERSSVLSTIGDTHYAAGQTDSAFVYYTVALEENPNNMLALNNCAYYLAVEGRDLDRAEKMSETTLKNNPENTTALDTYAWIMFKKKNYTQAQVYIDRALDLENEPSEELYSHAGDIYFMNGDPTTAVEMWKKALELAPDNDLLKRKVAHKTYFYE